MSKLEVVRHLYEYNEYANARLLALTGELPDDELKREPGSGASFGSLLATLAHIASAQEIWLSRWTTGHNPRSVLDVQAMASLDEVRNSMEQTHSSLREFVPGLTEARLDADLDYRDSTGTEHRRPLWQLMIHVVNHGTYHRGEAAMALTALGHSPGDLDFSFWERSRSET